MAVPNRFLAARQLFEHALELSPSGRDEYLASECRDDPKLLAEVESLLAAHDLTLPDEPDSIAEKPGDVFDRYKLLQQIGEGGFGTVWMAEQLEPVRRKVALKVIKLGMDTRQIVARFEAERQALAMMDHPNIARIFDGGVTPTGRPYFVMELVRGEPITAFCDAAQLGVVERLELFQKTCFAVQHAHQKGIIHRDIKPSNVLVALHDGVPVPKIIDFGIAKATATELTRKTVFTAFKQMLGTPEYMSPEQAELSGLDVDTRADIYSLGVLLYELLTGTPPFNFKLVLDRGFVEMLRLLREEDPPRPSMRVSTHADLGTETGRRQLIDPKHLARSLRGDLDRIVMKALEKNRTRRYDTATAFAEDIGRHLRHEPVLAAPPGLSYRVRKYVRRHWVAVTATGAALLGLLGGLGFAVWGFVEARDREAEARTEALRAATVLDLVDDMLSAADPHMSNGKDRTVRQLLDTFERGLGDRLADAPEVGASVERLIGRAYLGLGLTQTAAPHIDRALATRRQLRGVPPVDMVESLCDRAQLLHDLRDYRQELEVLDEAEVIAKRNGEATFGPPVWQHRADVLRHLGHYDSAEEFARRAVEAVRTAGNDRDLASCLLTWARILGEQRRFGEAKSALEAARDLLRRQHGDTTLTSATVLNELALVLSRLGNNQEAEETSRQAVLVTRDTVGEQHPAMVAALRGLALTLRASGRPREAEATCRNALDLARRIEGSGYSEIASDAMKDLGSVLAETGDLEGAVAMLREVVQQQASVLDVDDPVVIDAKYQLAFALTLKRDLAEAESLLRAVMGQLEGRNDLDGAYTSCLIALGENLFAQERYEEAERGFRKALELARARPEPVNHESLAALQSLSKTLSQRGDFRAAETAAREALAQCLELLGPDHPAVAATLEIVSRALIGQGKYPEALSSFEEAVRILRQSGEVTQGLITEVEWIAHLLSLQHENGKAEPYWREVVEGRRKLAGPDHADTLKALRSYGLCLMALGKYEEAERVTREAFEGRCRRFGRDDPLTLATECDLAEQAERQGKWQEALRLRQELLPLQRKALGNDDPRTLQTLNGLGLVLGNLGQHEAGLKFTQDAWEGRCRALGTSDPKTINSLETIAWHHYMMRQFEEAIADCQKALPLTRVVFGDDSKHTLQILHLLGDALGTLGRHAEAEPFTREAWERRCRVSGADDEVALSSQSNLAWHLQGQGKWEQAVEVELGIVEARRRTSPGQTTLANALAAAGLGLLHTDRETEAEPLLRECVALRAALVPDSWYYFNALSLLGGAMAKQGRHEEAEPLLVEGFESMQPPPEMANRKREALERLIEHYENWGKPDRASRYRALLGGDGPIGK